MNTYLEKENNLAKYQLLEKFSPFIKPQNRRASALFTEHIDFDLSYFPLKHLGYKVIVATMMDIFAMNATPKQVGINVALSNRFSENAIEELMGGVIHCCARYNIDIVELDFKPSATGLIIAVSMTGEAEPDRSVSIASAQENELICVTGDLGSAYTGLILLEREKKVFEADPTQQPDFIGIDYLLERYLKPEPPEWALSVRTQDFAPLPTSMIHLNDGLATGLIRLCNASKLGCTIFEEKLPIDILTFDKLKDLGIVATTIALNGGEDYELLFTVKQDDYDRIKDIKEISVIGYMTPESSGRNIVTNDNKQFELKAQGF